MIALAELPLLQWRYPLAAMLVLLPLLLTWLARWRARRSYAEPALRPWAVEPATPGAAARGRTGVEWLGWALLAVAAAGPRIATEAATGDRAAASPRHSIEMMVVLDVSASMAATDVAPDRLTRARLELAALQRRLRGERVGLVVFSGRAGLLLPLTDDPALFAAAIEQANAALLDGAGSDVAHALRFARSAFDRPGSGADVGRRRGRAVLLVSDVDTFGVEGALGEAAEAAVDELRGAGIPLFVLAVAGAEGAPIPVAGGGRVEQDGAAVISRPAAGVYRRWARSTGGDFTALADGDAHWQRLYDAGIATLPAGAVAPERLRGWRELYHLPLSLALLALLWAYLPARLPRAAALLVLLPVLAAGTTAEASDPALAAWQAYRADRFDEAQQRYERLGGWRGRMGAGAAAFRLGDQASASRHFGAALLLARSADERDDALYNLGHAHFAAGRLATAAQAWRAVLLSRPNDERAGRNLAVAEAALKERARTLAGDRMVAGRRGSRVEGSSDRNDEVDADFDAAGLTGTGVLADSAAAAAGARLDGEARGSAASYAPGLLQSGLNKISHLAEQPQGVLRGLLQQDRRPGPAAKGARPW